MSHADATTLQVERAAIPASDDQVASEINERLQAFRWSRVLMAATGVSGVFVLSSGFSLAAMLLCGALLVWAIVQLRRELQHRRIEFAYDLDGQAKEVYETSVQAFEAVSGCSAIWRVTTERRSSDTKYTAGAEATIDRVPTQIAFNAPRLVSNVTTVWLSVAGGALCLLPDRMLFFGPAGAVSLKYPEVRCTARSVDFREGGPVPRDSVQVGTTWQFVNKNGGPDRRFSNNRQIPIVRYSDAIFECGQLSFILQFSRSEAAAAFCQCLNGLSMLSKYSLSK